MQALQLQFEDQDANDEANAALKKSGRMDASGIGLHQSRCIMIMHWLPEQH